MGLGKTSDYNSFILAKIGKITEGDRYEVPRTQPQLRQRVF